MDAYRACFAKMDVTRASPSDTMSKRAKQVIYFQASYIIQSYVNNPINKI